MDYIFEISATKLVENTYKYSWVNFIVGLCNDKRCNYIVDSAFRYIHKNSTQDLYFYLSVYQSVNQSKDYIIFSNNNDYHHESML